MSVINKQILIVDDDNALAQTMANSFNKREFKAQIANDLDAAVKICNKSFPKYCVLDLRLGQTNGLECLQKLLIINPEMKIVMLTGYASINTAVEAIKLGACHYLAKPANADDIINAFNRLEGDINVDITSRPSSIKNLEWETIQETLLQTNFNISETARRLGMHRRTLARKLQKQPVK